MKKLLLSLIALLILPFVNGISQPVAFDSLDINNINARINSNGSLFTFVDSIHQTQWAKFEVPKGSGKYTIFRSNLWVAGLDIYGMLHVAAEEFNEVGHDFFAGPISNIYDSTYDATWNKTWKVYRSDIDYFKAHWWQSGYVIPASILKWPGNGNVLLGQALKIAPFFDRNNDGIYNPHDGDYPLIKGDEAIFFVINDARKLHSETHGIKFGIEIRGMAYAFACNADSAIWNTVFINYRIINRSTKIYQDSYISMFADLDIGYAADDYIGCDVGRGSYYAYNSRNIDGSGQSYAYGAYPPAQSVTFLAGPVMDSDYVDNPSGQCDASINGTNFGNGIIDDERFGMSGFSYYNNDAMGAPSYSIDPVSASDYYNYIQGIWKDGTQMQYGGDAHSGAGAYGPACHFMFPANSDTCSWGTGGNPPNGPLYWTEQTAGNIPNDRRGLGSCGPFTFEPGAEEDLDIAFVFGRNYLDTNAWSAVQVMQQRIDSIRKYFKNDTTPCGGSFSGITANPDKKQQIIIYPDPATDNITIVIPEKATIEILNIEGQLIKRMNTNENQTTIDISNFAKGIYFVKLKTDKGIAVKKFLKI